MTTRRAFLSVVGAAALAITGQSRAQSRPTIDVRKFGASGGGKVPDLRQVRQALETAARQRGGATVYFPPGEYYLGAVEDADLLPLKNLRNVSFVGERATLSCKTFNRRSGIFVISGSRDISIQGLTFRDRGLDRDNVSGAYAVSCIGDGAGTPSENISVSDCSFESVLGAVCTHGDEGKAPPLRGMTLKNLTIKNAVYGMNFADMGDDVTARSIICVDVMRSYFPYGVSNHDIEVDTRDNATGFTDVLISCYRRDTRNLQIKLKSRGKRGGDTIINLDHQNKEPGHAIRNITIDADVDDVDCNLNAAIQFRAMDRNRRIERTTDRRWDAITLDGDFRICDKTKLFYFESLNRIPGTLNIGPRLARNPRLPKSFPGFNATIVKA